MRNIPSRSIGLRLFCLMANDMGALANDIAVCVKFAKFVNRIPVDVETGCIEV